MNERMDRCWAEVDRAALRHNAGVARSKLGAGVNLMAVVKANAYGHGMVEVAKTLQGEVQLFGVANVAEALELRARVPEPILILGPALPSERKAIIEAGFIAVVSSAAEAEAYSRGATGRRHPINVVFDTGMGRIGVPESAAVSELLRIAALPNLEIHSLASHLPSADEDQSYTRDQLSRFAHLIQEVRTATGLDVPVHVLPSAGILGFSQHAHNFGRAGLMLYGISPLPEFQELLQPVMSLKSRIVLVRELAAGASISYGRTFITSRPTMVATLAIGYADGYMRAVSGQGACVLVEGKRCPLLGRVTMDLIMIDVSEVPEVEVADEVVLFGRQGGEIILASELAAWAGTIPWEIFTGIGARVRRLYHS
jgi:alanine racemase